MGGDSPAAGAVFLSYASQDAEAARRVCDALRAGGIEVWFDQSELRGGDAWDQKIRRQIRECALFMALISAHTDARPEGYFRREWRLAVDRTQDMADDEPFLLPVVIDDTSDATARVPDRYRQAQWTRLPDGVTPSAFVERVSSLLAPDRHNSRAPTRPSPASTPKARTIPRAFLALLLLAAVAVVGVGYFALDRFGVSKRVADVGTPSAPALRAVTPAQVVPERSIAVLPFVDMSQKHDQEYFSDGLSEELINHLSHNAELKVIARTSSFYFKGKSETISTIAQELGVANILEGSVRKAGNTVRVTAQLIRAENGYQLWSATYDRNVKDIFTVQDEIAGAVVAALKLKLASAEQVSRSRRTANTEAYNQYLLGRHFASRSTRDGYRLAVNAFHNAIALDSKFAPAYAGLAIAENFVADETNDPAGFRRAKIAAEEAVSLAPDLVDGYVSRGFMRYVYEWDWAGAQADLEKALAIDGSDTRAQHDYAALLSSLGRLPDAIAVVRRAVDGNPLSHVSWQNLGIYLCAARQFPAARQALARALEISPDSIFNRWNLGVVELLDGQPRKALTLFQQIKDPLFSLTGIALAEHSLGQTQPSQKALDELVKTQAQAGADQLAEIYAWRGENDQAFVWLERAYAQRDGGLVDLKTDPLFRSLRGDPRYKTLLRKMNLPQ